MSGPYPIVSNKPNGDVHVIYNPPHVAVDQEAEDARARLAASETPQPNPQEEMLQEISHLRPVYEAARQVLRFTGVDAQRTQQAWHKLEDTIETMKVFDGGTWDDATGPVRFPISDATLHDKWKSNTLATFPSLDFEQYKELVRDIEAHHGIDYPSQSKMSLKYAGQGVFEGEKLSEAARAWAQRQHRMGQEALSEFLQVVAQQLEVVEDKTFHMRIYGMCDAYESGIGHGLKGDGLDNADGSLYGDNLACNLAYRIGYKQGQIRKGWEERRKKEKSK